MNTTPQQDTATQQHDNTGILQHNSTAKRHHNTTAQHYNITTPQHHNNTIQHHNNTTPQHHSTTTPQHHNTTAPQHHSTAPQRQAPHRVLPSVVMFIHVETLGKVAPLLKHVCMDGVPAVGESAARGVVSGHSGASVHYNDVILHSHRHGAVAGSCGAFLHSGVHLSVWWLEGSVWLWRLCGWLKRV